MLKFYQKKKLKKNNKKTIKRSRLVSSYMNIFSLREPASAEGQPEVGLETKHKYLSDNDKDDK